MNFERTRLRDDRDDLETNTDEATKAVLDDGQNTEDEFGQLDRSRSINDPDNDEAREPIINVTSWKIPQKKFLHIFPSNVDAYFRKFDDAGLKLCQFTDNKIVLYWNLFITIITTIESGIAIPAMLFVLGYDGLATQFAYLMVLLVLVSQIPKRFIWRYRPYMVHRGRKMRKKETATSSSFPSRAVTCGTVYSFFGVYGYLYTSGTSSIEWWMPLVVMFAVFSTSFARIHMGVHYPTDCIGGFLQGSIVCLLGTLMWKLDVWNCESCFDNSCYSMGADEIVPGHVGRVSWTAWVVSVVICVLITILSVMKPIDFWEKCDKVYGMLLPGIVFQITMLCPGITGSSLGEPSSIPWYGYFYAMALPGAVTGLGFIIKGRYPVASFFLQFCIMYFGFFIWRVWGLPQ